MIFSGQELGIMEVSTRKDRFQMSVFTFTCFLFKTTLDIQLKRRSNFIHDVFDVFFLYSNCIIILRSQKFMKVEIQKA